MNLMPMQECHIEEIVTIEALCFSTPWTKTSFVEELQNSRSFYLVALEDDRVLGYGGLHHVLDEGELVNIAVHPEAQGRGIGTMLLNGLLDMALLMGVSTFFLEVRASNQTAQRLYKRFGFLECGNRKKYYANPEEDAIIMKKSL